MAAIYGMLVALPMVWGCAGYVLVSQPGTAEPIDSRAAAKLIAPRKRLSRARESNIRVFDPPIRQHTSVELLQVAKGSQ